MLTITSYGVLVAAVGACSVPTMPPASGPTEAAEPTAPAQEKVTVDMQTLLRPPKAISVLTSGERSGLCRIAVTRLAEPGPTKLADGTPEVQEVRRALLQRGFTVVASEAGARVATQGEAKSGGVDFKPKRADSAPVGDGAATLQRAEQFVALGSVADAVLIIDDAGTWRRKMRAEVDANGKVKLTSAGPDAVSAQCTDSGATLPVEWYSVGLLARLVSLRTAEPRVVADISAFVPLGEPLEPASFVKATYEPIIVQEQDCVPGTTTIGDATCVGTGTTRDVITGYTPQEVWCTEASEAVADDERRTSARPWATAYRALVEEVLAQVLADECGSAK